MLLNKKIVLGVTGGAAIYKSLELVRLLKKEGAEVYPVMTRSAAKLISPQLFSAIAGNQAHNADPMQHIRLQKADLICVAPATANFIGKLAHGIADDLLTTTVMAFAGPVVIAPAMNTVMWNKPVVQRNLEEIDAIICGPQEGELACGDYGSGRMSEPKEIFDYCELALSPKDLEGKRFLITSGSTQEPWDDVRYLTNRSSGLMGQAFAREAWLRGADVTLVEGGSADEMFEEVKRCFQDCDVFVSAAAVADFKPVSAEGKIKKDAVPSIELERNPDILKWCSENRKNQKLIGFVLEDSDLEARARIKKDKKGCDLMIGNTLSNLGSEKGEVLILGKETSKVSGSKQEIAGAVLDLLAC